MTRQPFLARTWLWNPHCRKVRETLISHQNACKQKWSRETLNKSKGDERWCRYWATFPAVILLLEMLKWMSSASLFHCLALNQRKKLEEGDLYCLPVWKPIQDCSLAADSTTRWWTQGTPWPEKGEENGIFLKIITMCEASLVQVFLKQFQQRRMCWSQSHHSMKISQPLSIILIFG